jgi:hypothetical protein
MPSRPTSGKCIYCLDDFNELTWDHVLPISWYPESTPRNIEKWKVPACLECNKHLGNIEEDLLLRLALCLDPKSIASLGIPNKALRSVNPLYGKNEKDKKIRELKRIKLLEQISHREQLPEREIFPNFGPQTGLIYPNGYHIISIPENLLQSYNQKLVRGMSYVLDKIFLSKDYSIELIIVDQNHSDIQPLQELFRNHSALYNRGIGFVVKRISEEKGKAWIYEFTIWQKLKFYSVVQHISLEAI